MKRRIPLRITVEANGSFKGQLPEIVQPGEHQAVLEFESLHQNKRSAGKLTLPCLEFEVAPDQLQFSRDEIYAGRH